MLLTIGASAINHAEKVPALNKKSIGVNLGVFNSVSAKMQAGHLFDANVKAKKVMKAVKAAKAEDIYSELKPAYSTEIEYYLDSLGFVTENLYDGASFLVKDSKAYFAPFAYCDYVEGVVESGECWYQKLLKAYGYNYKVDSITFTANVVIAQDQTGNEYVAAVGEFDGTTYTAERSTAATFGAYYFADFDELQVNDIIGLYDKAGLKSTPVLGYCYASFDLQPQELLNPYFYKGTFTVQDAFDEGEDAGKVYTGDATIYMDYDGLCIKGFDLYTGPNGNYVRFSYPEDKTSQTGYDNSSATVEDFQHFSTVTSQTGAWYDIVTRGVNASFTAWATPGFFIDVNEDETVSVESDGMAMLLGFSFDLGGSIEALQDLAITITPEQVYAGVKGITTAGKATSTEYFDLQGRKVNGNQKGLLIKKSTLSDGTVKSVKMLNK